jgi:hypothetical protein
MDFIYMVRFSGNTFAKKILTRLVNREYALRTERKKLNFRAIKFDEAIYFYTTISTYSALRTSGVELVLQYNIDLVARLAREKCVADLLRDSSASIRVAGCDR